MQVLNDYKTRMKKRETMLKTLLRDYGYKFESGTIYSLGIRGFTSTQAVRRARDLCDAVEQLVPIVKEPAFFNRYKKILEL